MEENKNQVPETKEEPGNEEDVVSLSREEYNKIVGDLANRTQDKENLVNEIKDLREKKQDAEAKVKEVENKPETPETTPESTEMTPEKIAEVTSETVQKLFEQQSEEVTKSNRISALNKFKETNKEFHPDNDEGGLKLSAFEKELANFNITGLKSEVEFLSVFNKAKTLLGNEKKPEVINQTPYADTPSEGGGNPKEVEDHNLTSQEVKLIDQTFGGDKERYLKQKAKRPDYVAEMLRWAK